ncbi:hypothetical protein KFE25_001557 [Diacronema lutheri]|uniref:DnaJ homologue subfamily C member 28 conserved domain-containing protein n=1 Tax=Diacronema lutheri TaxID=2081491 RepID=A0A8J5X880_DIALT|nr:hypothetical protein KFE25_001557 [Diacronema lutheri]
MFALSTHARRGGLARLRLVTPSATVRAAQTDAAAGAADEPGAPNREMARGARGARGSGKSLIGSNNQYGAQPGEFTSLTELEGSDMLVEVLAEEYRHKRGLEFRDDGLSLGEVAALGAEDGEDAKAGTAPPPKGPFMQHRKYLTHRGVGDGTVFARDAMAARQRLEGAQEGAYDYRLPAAVKAQRDALERQRKHGGNLVEEAIMRAIADGHFDNLEGRGKPLPDEVNPFEDAGLRTFNRILKKAGCAPRWVEENRDIRRELQISRLYLAARWIVLETTARAAAADAAARAGDARAGAAERSHAAHARARRAWESEAAAFDDKVRSLNKRVHVYNLMAPTAAAVLQIVDVQRELADVREGRTVFDEAALRDLDDGSSFQLTLAASLPRAAPSGAETPGDWTGGIALAPLPRDSFSLADVPWPRWQDIVAVFRFR